jgi:hypothetical protein
VKRKRMDNFSKFVTKLIKGFNSTNLDYAFTGALAVSFYGVPRTTSDVDVMISVLEEAEVKAKVAISLKHAGLKVEERKIDEALISGYNIPTFIDVASPFTVDVIFSRGPLEKQAGIIAGLETFFQSPEGLILAKLRMIKATLPKERTLKDQEDVRAVLAFSKVDLKTLRRQAKKQGTLDILETLMT